MRLTVCLLLFVAALQAGAATGRSTAAVVFFKKQHPCPVTGKPRGACPGWQVDHIHALKCGGPDAPDNMQWLTVEAHKEKTKRDMRGCRSRPND
jgi:5-methylcytosine-specific restriction endonuclease McrA